MTVYELIKDAIQHKKIITADFKGFYREMCPHHLGTKNGKYNCLFYQFGGFSSSGLSSDPFKNWRCIPIDLLQNVQVIEGNWHTAGNHTRPSTCIDDTHFIVDF